MKFTSVMFVPLLGFVLQKDFSKPVKKETDRQKRCLQSRTIKYNPSGRGIGYPEIQISLLSTIVSLIPLVIFLPT